MRLTLLTLLLTLTAVASAQSTEDALKARLLHQPLYLRHTWGSDKLHFDATGAPIGKVPLVSFTLAGIEIRGVKLKGHSVELTGVRVGLEFVKMTPKRVTLQVRNSAGPGTHDEDMKLTLDAPPDGDYSTTLDAIFTTRLEDLVPEMPFEWQSFAKAHILNVAPAEPPLSGNLRKIGGSVIAPKVLKAPEPEFSEAARALRWSGNVLVYLQVDKAGAVSHLRLLDPCGLGLDERALVVVSQYRFSPAMDNGQPVAVELNVEVNFQFF